MSHNGLVLRGLRFNPIFGASGTLGNFNEGYAYHAYLKKLFPESFDLTGATFVSKTTTDAPREGNMPLDEHFQPREFLPKCIYANPFKGIALNTVGLSNPGINALLATEKWQRMTQPFFISFAPADGKNLQERLEETIAFANLIKKNEKFFKAKFGIQINISCPNMNHDLALFIKEATELGYVLRSILGEIPIDLKINAMTKLQAIKAIQKERAYDSITCSNTIPFGEMPEWINWKKLFGSDVSPLIKRGFKQPGGLSGKPLLPIVERWIKEARDGGIKIPLIAGGGILCPDDVILLKNAGASAIAIGSAAFLRPWNVQAIIQQANSISWRR